MSEAGSASKPRDSTRKGGPRVREATVRRREEILKAALATFGNKG